MLDDVGIDSQGMCNSFVLVDFDKDLLETAKEKHLGKSEYK